MAGHKGGRRETTANQTRADGGLQQVVGRDGEKWSESICMWKHLLMDWA